MMKRQEELEISDEKTEIPPINSDDKLPITNEESKPFRAASDVTPVVDGDDAIPFSAFTKLQKNWMIFLIAFAGMFSPMSSFIYYPAINAIADGLGTSIQNVNLTITSYMVVSGVVPALIGNIADTLGRRPVYIAAFVTYVLANVGLAVQRSFPALLILRMVQSAGSSGTISLGYGVIADISTPAERGSYVGTVLLGPNVAPSFGPVLGGVIASKLGWSYVFWFLCGLSGLCLVIIVLSLPETARCIVGDGSIPPRGIYRPLLPVLGHLKHRQMNEDRPRRSSGIILPNPIQSLRILLEKDSAIIVLCTGIFYTVACCLQASLSSLFIELYGYGELEAGLIYIPFGAGSLVSVFLTGKLLDFDYASTAKSEHIDVKKGQHIDIEQFPIEKARLRSIFYPVCACTIGVLGYGWALEKKTHVSIPLIIQAVCGFATASVFTILGTLLTDTHPKNSSTAAAATNIVRCSLAAGGTAVVQILIDSVGPGWCFTIMGALCGLCVPLFMIERHYGPRWRNSRSDKRTRVSETA